MNKAQNTRATWTKMLVLAGVALVASLPCCHSCSTPSGQYHNTETEQDAEADSEQKVDRDSQTFEVFTLSNGTDASKGYSVDNGIAVFLSAGTGIPEISSQTLFVFNLHTGNRTSFEPYCGEDLCGDSVFISANYPAVSAGYAHYLCGYSVDDCWERAIWQYDISTGTVRQRIPADGSARRPTYLRAAGGRVAWIEQKDGISLGRIYSQETGVVQTVTDESLSCAELDLTTEYLAYITLGPNGGLENNNVHLHEFSTGNTIAVTSDTTWQFWPRVSDKYVVWVDLRNGLVHSSSHYPPLFENSDIYIYDIEAGATSILEENDAEQTDPDADGNLVCWTDYRHGYVDERYLVHEGEVYCKDLSTDTTRRITDTSGDNLAPVVSGEYVVFWHRPDDSTNNQELELHAVKLELPLR